MRAGTLNKRLIIESRDEQDDETGEPIVTWNNFAQVWAAIEPGKGREFVSEAQPHAQGDLTIRIRYLPGVREKMRARWGDEIYDILAVRNLNESLKETHLLCIKGLSDG